MEKITDININPTHYAEDNFSDLEIDYTPSENNDYVFEDNSDDLQRTKEWFEQRRGKWTGTTFKELMTCSKKASSWGWDVDYKIIAFSAGIPKKVFAKAMERITGITLEKGSSIPMRYGAKIEPLVQRRIEEENPNIKVNLLGFVDSKDLPNTGVSSDGDAIEIDEILNLEMKSTTSWEGYFDRVQNAIDEKHDDFWQIQGQMMVRSLNQTLYVVTSPPSDILKYVKSENPMEFYEEWKAETITKYFRVQKSPIHLHALTERIKIVEKACVSFVENPETSINELIYNEVEEYKNNFDAISIDLSNDFFEEEQSVDEVEEITPEPSMQSPEEVIESEPQKQKEVDPNDLPF